MSKISPNFSRKEFACKCGCGLDTVDVELIQIAELVRSKVGSFTPNSGIRCEYHNNIVGGGKESQHLYGKAMDIPCESAKEVYEWLDGLYPNKYGIGLYNTFIHVDVRSCRARWDNR